MVPERFEDLLEAFDRDGGDDEGLARAFREEVLADLAGAKRLLEEGRSRRAQQALDEALRTARELVADGTGSVDPGATPDTGHGGYRVVIVDGTRTRRSLHRTLLEEAGPFDVVAEAADEARALDAVRARAPDLLLLDLATPEQDSLAVLSEIEQTAPEVAVAVLPAFADERFAARARDAGVDLYLQKEVGGAELVDRLHELVSGPHSGR